MCSGIAKGLELLDRQALLGLMEDNLGIDTSEIEDDTVLFSSGLMDSFSLVRLITAIEATTGAKVSPLDVNLESFDHCAES